MNPNISHLFTKDECIYDSDETLLPSQENTECVDSLKGIIFELEKNNQVLERQNRSLEDLVLENEETIKKLMNQLNECRDHAHIEKVRLSQLNELVSILRNERDELMMASKAEGEKEAGAKGFLEHQNYLLESEKRELSQKIRDCQEEVEDFFKLTEKLQIQTLRVHLEELLINSEKNLCTVQNDKKVEIAQYIDRIQFLEEIIEDKEQTELQNSRLENVQTHDSMEHLLSDGIIAQCVQFTALVISFGMKYMKKSLGSPGVKADTSYLQMVSKAIIPMNTHKVVDIQIMTTLEMDLLNKNKSPNSKENLPRVISTTGMRCIEHNAMEEHANNYYIRAFFFLSLLLLWTALFGYVNLRTISENVEFFLRIGNFYVGLTKI